MTLKDLHSGESAVITRVGGTGAFRKRITEMGFVKGQTVEVLKSAPFKDPIEYQIMSGLVSLRRAEASMIEVSKDHSADDTTKLLDPIFTETVNPNGEFKPVKKISIALVGNPNSGKTTIYNRLSRSHERTGNFSGVTVTTKETTLSYKDYDITFTDLPGTYSLSAYSGEELVVRDFLNEHRPDIVVNVVDAGNINRHLYLTTQLIDMGVQVILALNMYDELEAKGDKLDMNMLGKLMGIPVVPTIGRRGKGIYRLLNRIVKVYEDREPILRHTHINYGAEVEQSIHKIEDELRPFQSQFSGQHLRYYAIRAIEKDDYCLHRLATFDGFEDVRPVILDEIYKLEQWYNEDTETLISDARYAFIRGALTETLKVSKRDPGLSKSNRIDRILTHKYFGFPIFLLILYTMFQATFSLGQYPMHWIELGVDGLGNYLNGIIPEGVFRDLVIDGVIGGVGGVIVFLPNILILFFIISLMEDTGYMARTAFIMDRLMHLIGLHGKSFIPLIMGFGCNVPAIMATRMLENRRDRMLTMLIIPFMSCSARLPVYILIAGAVFPDHAGNVIFVMYLIGILFSILMALLFKSTLFKKVEAPFVMELPLYRRPGAKMIVKHTLYKGGLYLKKMGGVILIASVIVWALGYFPRELEEVESFELRLAGIENSVSEGSLPAESAVQEVSQITQEMHDLQQLNSYIGRIGVAIEPVIRPLGFDWKMGISLISGFAAKEIVVSTMGVLYQADDSEGGPVSLQEKIKMETYSEGSKKGEKVYSPLAGFSFLLFVLLYLPCMAVIATIGREGGSWKWSAFVIFYTTALAWVVSFCVYQIGSLF